ncbi:MAG: type II toxin-antitoxin system VapC family toxin [Polyangiaceae bacterium]|nr:type II toxin-antitoxin system VapC family toxin [Polyangiaceae bacterium]MCW5790276.1 type II toxin-antitoxin system VapC family toxin [Polyangiaceae bacterium]
MKLILDTHALLWWLDGDRKLSRKVRAVLEASEAEVLVSAATVWEITTKARLGKLPGALDVARDVLACVAGQGFEMLDITGAHAQHAGSLRGAHRDPFDRMLIAQSLLEGASLATNEELFDEFGVARFW